MRILGVDPATFKPLGIALVSNGERLTVEYSGLCSYLDIPDIIKKCRPDLVVIEDQYMSRNYNTAKKLSWSAGKIMGICAIMRVPNCTMNVAHWKKIMKAQKTDKKDNTAHIRRCAEIFGQEYHDDVSSAILIASAYLTENT